ncbi:Unknown protein sequence [Pseudomonas syringae pv. primulae]|uniref:Uncharacterized protein n=1 Tax=Pseudomonas syringae pv. primulae TaxID=251707 RepID=A0A0P9XX77_9PSED|nr:Unknown protein sequence [Pseudomonas syringae pv. primulae]
MKGYFPGLFRICYLKRFLRCFGAAGNRMMHVTLERL